jgi:hypothetical protein
MIIGDFNYDGMKQMHKNLKRMHLAYPEFIKECLNELVLRLLAKTVARTPVGPTGDLRRGWAIGQIQQNGDEYQVELINPVEYALYVEHGHRTRNHAGWVEGRFMLTISVDELERELPAFMDQKLKQFMERLMG